MVAKLAAGLAGKGHTVHVVTPDLAGEEQRGPTEWWWGPDAHPTKADAVVMVPSLSMVEPYEADHLILATNGVGHDMGPNGEWAAGVDAFPVFSNVHADLLVKSNPHVNRDKCIVTGLGIDLGNYSHGLLSPAETHKVPGRLLYGNDPQRGLWHVLDVFDALKREVPFATLNITYDWPRQFEAHRWAATALAEEMWGCKRRIETTDGIVSLDGLSPEQVVREQMACQVHAMPSDPPNAGTQIHGIFQMECAAAGAALVLSDTEAFPEVFGEAAEILPTPGTFMPSLERRYDAEDWTHVIAQLMRDDDAWRESSRKARALAERHTWETVITRWDKMLAALSEGALAHA